MSLRRPAADLGARPEHHLRVAVLADDLRVHRARIEVELLAERLPQRLGLGHVVHLEGAAPGSVGSRHGGACGLPLLPLWLSGWGALAFAPPGASVD